MKHENTVMRGRAASPGFIQSEVYVMKNTAEFVRIYSVDDPEDEIRRFEHAIEQTKRDLIKTRDRVEEKIGNEYMGIFEAQILALEDREVLEKTRKRIRENRKNADYVYNRVVNEILETMGQIDDEYLKDRIYDIKDILNRVLRKLKRKSDNGLNISRPVILAANTFTPSDLINIDKNMINGIISERGSVTSHFAIMARALNIPAVVGVNNLLDSIEHGDTVIIDGFTGIIIIDPDETSKKMYHKKRDEYAEYSAELREIVKYEAITLDQRSIELSANIELLDETDEVKRYGAKGVGLFRTEFLYFNSNTMPGVEEHLNTYSQVAGSVYPDSLIIRTVDIGGDKPVFVNKREDNPFLGFRGIRASLEHTAPFKEQIEAILRSNTKGNVKMMLPIVSTVDEVVRAKGIIAEVKEDLIDRGIEFNGNIDLGIMVEVPSCALMADEFAKHVDFFSIGTNDLTQYTLAVDRTNPMVSNIYDNLEPAVLKLIDMTIKSAHDNQIWCGVCGEMASMPIAVPILIGMEIDELSMSPVFIPEVKKIIREITFEESRGIAGEVLSMKSGRHVREYMKELILSKFPNMKQYLED